MIPGIQYVSDLQEKLRAVEKINERQSKVITVFFNKNNELWLALAKHPGGLDDARRIGRSYLATRANGGVVHVDIDDKDQVKLVFSQDKRSPEPSLATAE